MKLKTKELLTILSKLKPGLADKSIVEQATHFIFTGKQILTYNDQICIVYPFETGFHGSVPARELYKVLSDIKQDEIELSHDEANLIIQSKGTKANLLSHGGEEILELVKVLKLTSIVWQDLPEGFLEGVFLCMFSASKDVTQPVLSRISVADTFINSSDRMRISNYEMQGPIDSPFLLSRNDAQELVKFSITKYCVGDNWVYFGMEDGVIFCSRVVKEQYPDTEEYFELEGVRIKLPKDLKQSVDSVLVLAEGDSDIDKKIDVEIAEGKIRCKGERDVGWIENELDIRYSKEKGIKFSINPIFFSQVLEKATTVICGEERALFRSGSFKLLVLLYVE